jgi:hypothetical protein
MTKRKEKAIPVTGRGGPNFCETSRLPHFLVGSQTVVRLSALRAGCRLPQGYSLPSQAVSTPEQYVDERFGQVKNNPMTSSGIENATF